MRKRLDELTKKELQELARDKQVRNYSTMSKAELVEALEKAQQRKKPRPEGEAPGVPPAAQPEQAQAAPPQVPAPAAGAAEQDQAAPRKARQNAVEPALAEEAGKGIAFKKFPPKPGGKTGPRAGQPARQPAAQAEPAAASPPETKITPPETQPAAITPPLAGQAMATGAAPAGEPAAEETTEKQELAVQASKYQTRASGTRAYLLDEWPDLPASYGQNRITLIPVDPYRLHAYWELTGEAVAQARAKGGPVPILRLYDVTNILFDGTNAHSFVDIPRGEDSTSWYLDIPFPQHSYLVDIGYLRADGTLLVLARSHAAVTPPAVPSSVTAEQFATIPYQIPISAIQIEKDAPPATLPALWGEAPAAPPAPPARKKSRAAAKAAAAPQPTVVIGPARESQGQLQEIYAPLQVPVRQAPPAPRGAEVWQLGSETWQVMGPLPALEQPGGASEAVSSWGWGSVHLAAPAPARGHGRNFWLIADAELIVYGATEPDARVTVQGHPVALRPDGSFRLHFALPDGLQHIPIHALAADGEQQRQITIDVQRATTWHEET